MHSCTHPVSLCPAEPRVPVHSPGIEAWLGQVEAAVVPRPARPGVHAVFRVAGVHLQSDTCKETRKKERENIVNIDFYVKIYELY